MADGPPTSVLLPTTRWTDACGEVADQLNDGDELLVVHDDVSDPVADREPLPDGVRLVAAGEPAGCSGKASAIAAGMDAASHDRIVWTDDDFHHPPDWLASLNADYERHGPVSEVPYFVGRDPLSVVLEPVYAAAGSLGIYLGDEIWGGSVVFERGDLDGAAFLDELRRTVSDDALLAEHLEATAVGRTRTVPAGGSVRATVERHVRWTKILLKHDPWPVAAVHLVLLGVLAAVVLSPVVGAVALTVLHFVINEVLGVRRWTAVLAVPSVVVAVALAPYALARRTFTWGGRRYRWRSKFDVEVVGATDEGS